MQTEWTIDGVPITSEVPTEPGMYVVHYLDDGGATGGCDVIRVCAGDDWPLRLDRLWGPRLPEPVRVEPPLTCIRNHRAELVRHGHRFWRVQCVADGCGVVGPCGLDKPEAVDMWHELRRQGGGAG